MTKFQPFYKMQTESALCISVAKIVELVGSSPRSWEDAAQAAVNEAIKTIRGVREIEVTDMTAKVDSKTGKIHEYGVC